MGCGWGLGYFLFFFHNFILLLCVKSWDKPFVLQTYTIINLCVFLIVKVFTRKHVYVFNMSEPIEQSP